MDLDEKIKQKQQELDVLMFQKYGLQSQLDQLLEKLRQLKLIAWGSSSIIIMEASDNRFCIKLNLYSATMWTFDKSLLQKLLRFQTREEAELFLRIFEKSFEIQKVLSYSL